MATRKLEDMPGIIVNPTGGSGSGIVKKVDFNNLAKPVNCIDPTDPGDGVNLSYLETNYVTLNFLESNYFPGIRGSFEPSVSTPNTYPIGVFSEPAFDLDFRIELEEPTTAGAFLQISNLNSSKKVYMGISSRMMAIFLPSTL